MAETSDNLQQRPESWDDLTVVALAYSPEEANLIVAVLAEEGIDAVMLDENITHTLSYLRFATHSKGIRVAVLPDHARRAWELVEQMEDHAGQTAAADTDDEDPEQWRELRDRDARRGRWIRGAMLLILGLIVAGPMVRAGAPVLALVVGGALAAGGECSCW